MTTLIDPLADAPIDTYPLLDRIIAFEDGTLPFDETVEFFQHLVDTGLAWDLQGIYGRTAVDFIEAGLVGI